MSVSNPSSLAPTPPSASMLRRLAGWPGRGAGWLRAAAGRNRSFTVALAVGALIRLVAVIGFPGALWFGGDSEVYVGAALRPQPNLSKSTGYSLFLRLLLPLHSFTLVAVAQHLMGLGDAVIIYWLLRRNGVARKWSTIATLPVLLDGFMIEDEHLVMAEALFTFCLMLALLLVMRTRTMGWVSALAAGLLLGYATVVRTEGLTLLAVFPLFVLVRGWRVYGWKKVRGWLAAVVMAIGCLLPVAGYAAWFHSFSGSYGLTRSTGFYLWGRVSSFANCSVIKPTGAEAAVCPKEPLADRTPPGDFIWHAPEVHQDMGANGPVSVAGNKVLTDFALHAVEAQPLGYVKAVVGGMLKSVELQRTDYPSAGTVYYYYFHRHEVAIPHHMWIAGGYADQDWVSYGHATPGRAIEPFAAALIGYQRVVWTWGPLFGIILILGLGGIVRFRRPVRQWRARRGSLPLRRAPRGASMFPWVVAIVVWLTPIALADFDYRYLLPVLPAACLAAGLAFRPAASPAASVPARDPAAGSAAGSRAQAATPEGSPVQPIGQ